MTERCLLTLVSGAHYPQREAAIAAAIHAHPADETSAVVLEGLPDGNQVLCASATLQLQRIAPGCLCCLGNLVLRVTLNRILRHPPVRLYLSLANSAHLDQLIELLQLSPYNELLVLEQNLRL